MTEPIYLLINLPDTTGTALVTAIRTADIKAPILVVTGRKDGAIENALLEGGAGALFTVRDHGPGIATDAAAHIFDRYWQGRRRRSGAGLGLAIAKGVIEARA